MAMPARAWGAAMRANTFHRALSLNRAGSLASFALRGLGLEPSVTSLADGIILVLNPAPFESCSAPACELIY